MQSEEEKNALKNGTEIEFILKEINVIYYIDKKRKKQGFIFYQFYNNVNNPYPHLFIIIFVKKIDQKIRKKARFLFNRSQVFQTMFWNAKLFTTKRKLIINKTV